MDYEAQTGQRASLLSVLAEIAVDPETPEDIRARCRYQLQEHLAQIEEQLRRCQAMWGRYQTPEPTRAYGPSTSFSAAAISASSLILSFQT
jgi:hypothetical protein